MNKIIIYAVLFMSFVGAGFYIGHLRDDNKRLEAVETAYREQIEEVTETARLSVEIAIVRDAQINKLQEEQRGFHNAIKNAQQDEVFRNWGSSPLPADVVQLLKKNDSD